jgi:hypothetical protein
MKMKIKKPLLTLLTLTSLFNTPLASAGWADGFMDDANKAVEEAIRLEESVPIEEDKSLEGWTTDQATFNYKLPCDIDITTGVAIVVHGLNQADLLEENDEGEFVHARDISVAFPRMEELCLAITLPKSGLSATYEMVVTHPAKLKSSSTGTDSSAAENPGNVALAK